MQNKRVNAAAINALKEALTYIYWYKRDLRSFLVQTITNPNILSRLNWDNYKRHTVDQLVSYLACNQDKYLDEILNLIEVVCTFNDFSHLKRLEDGEEKANQAKNAVRALKKLSQAHLKLFDEKEKADIQRKVYSDQIEKVKAFSDELEGLNERYKQLAISDDHQQRGYELERLLNDLFKLFDLDPKASFKLKGEQLDGAYTFENTDYLVEAKWQSNPIRATELDGLAAKVRRKLDNTLGLFISINGFSPEAILTHSANRPVLLLMNGADLSAVLESRIDLQELLRRKRRHAAQTGNIFFQYWDML
jgi:hypothetical protein